MKKALIYITILLTLTPVFSIADEMTALKRVENYFNTMTTFKASFEQVIPGQDVAFGTFYIQRPRQFLWDYTTPNKQKLVSTGSNLYFFDESTQQATQLPLNSGLASLFVQSPFTLKGDTFLVDRFEENDTHMNITLRLKEAEDEVEQGKLSLIFKKEPFTLEKIVTEDHFGSRIHVYLKDIQTGLKLDEHLFDFTPPVDVWAE